MYIMCTKLEPYHITKQLLTRMLDTIKMKITKKVHSTDLLRQNTTNWYSIAKKRDKNERMLEHSAQITHQ